MDEKRVRWSHGEFSVTPVAAMLTDLVFHVDGADFRPLARAPWLDDVCEETGHPVLTRTTLRTHLDVLGGEFPCVPFGGDHGYGANAEWDLASYGRGVRATIEYPSDSAIARVQRDIFPVQGEARVEFELVVEARRAARLPLGLHPILRLPTKPRALSIAVDFEHGRTHPSMAATSHVTTHDTRFTTLSNVPAPSGSVDLARLPLPSDDDRSIALDGVDDGGMLFGARSPLSAHYLEDGAELVLEWDDAELPSINYWYSDRGLSDPPWRGRYRGLGLEPARAYFDYGMHPSVDTNPLSEAGESTSVALAAGEKVTITSALAARPRAAAHDARADVRSSHEPALQKRTSDAH